VQTIIVADAVMGIDNVLAVAGAAQGNLLLVILGLAISVPIVIGGSQLIGAWMVRWPLLVYIGAGIMAWTAGSMVVHDAIVGARLQAALGGIASVMLPALAAVLVCSWGWLRRKNLRTGGGTGIMEE
jgi:predicted tellurium resistance membrane protein TerC